MKTLIEFVRESRNIDKLSKDNFIVEGIEIDKKNHIIKLNNDSKGIDFQGPIEWTTDDGYSVISIFKRTKLQDDDKKDFDGNPFIYALKNKNGWKFDIAKNDIRIYLNRFFDNCAKINRHFDTIIMIPSSSKINEKFLSYIYNVVNANCKIVDMFSKQPLDVENLDILIDYKKIYSENNDNEAEKIIEYIERELFKLERENKDFEAKNFNKRYLKYLKFLNDNPKIDYIRNITNKDILVLDDTYSSGTTISQAIQAIKQNFEPKSITVITLLSKLFEK